MGVAVRPLSKEIGMAAGVRKPSDSQKAKALWKMTAARDRREDIYYPDRAYNIMGRKKTRLDLLEEQLKDPMVALEKAMQCLEYPQ